MFAENSHVQRSFTLSTTNTIYFWSYKCYCIPHSERFNKRLRVLAAQRDNESNTTNDYSMTEETNRGQAKEEAPAVESRQVQLDHWMCLVGRADNVQFVQHISAHLSHMCSLFTASSIVFGCIPKLFHTNLWRKVVPAFYMEHQFIMESQLSSTCKLILPPLHTPADKVFVYGTIKKKKKKPHNVLSVSFSCLCLPFTLRPYSCWTRTKTHKARTLWWMSHMCHPVSGVFLSVWVGSGVTQQALSSAEGELWKPVTNKQRDSLPASHSQMANLSRITNTLYNHI